MLVARSLRSPLPLSVTLSLLVALVPLVAPGCGGGTAPLVVTTTEGDVQGTLSEDEVIRAFLGVPYAAPPTGARRFLPPAAPLPHQDTLQATDFGPSCPGTRTPLDLVLRPRPADEDCLSLNIWTQAERGRRPVMLFIHGGGYVNGASNIPVYDGADLARNGDVVVVSINYRLAALGFLSTEALQAERAELDGGAGNMGILDMLAALRWVQANIRAFGGDPDNVTIFGESAGGSAVCSLLAATGAEGLFHRGIVQSGGCSATPLRGGSRGTFDVGDTLVERLGCTGEGELECLRALTTQEILDAVMEDASGLGFAPYGPAVDGATFSDSPAQLLADGVGLDVPLMVGSNLNEMTVFLLGAPRPASAAAMREQFLAAVGNDEAAADALMELYDVTTTEDAERAFEVFATDRSFACNALSIAETAASAGREVYLYEFQHVVGNQASTFGVGHGFELPYVFGTLDRFSLFSTMRGEREDRTVARAQAAWSSFARDGVPEFEGGGRASRPRRTSTWASTTRPRWTTRSARTAAPPSRSSASPWECSERMAAYPAEERLRDARALWVTAEGLADARDFDAALAALTRAHDLVTDIPSAHREAHQRLLPVDRALGRARDVRVDRILEALAPVGVFRVLGWYFAASEDYTRLRDPAAT